MDSIRGRIVAPERNHPRSIGSGYFSASNSFLFLFSRERFNVSVTWWPEDDALETLNEVRMGCVECVDDDLVSTQFLFDLKAVESVGSGLGYIRDNISLHLLILIPSYHQISWDTMRTITRISGSCLNVVNSCNQWHHHHLNEFQPRLFFSPFSLWNLYHGVTRDPHLFIFSLLLRSSLTLILIWTNSF